MKIEHVAIWVEDLEGMKSFYEKWFGATAGSLYHNPKKEFHSYFLQFTEGARIELMHKPGFTKAMNGNHTGLAHFALSVGSNEQVDELTSAMKKAGIAIADGPRWTGDGYYESVVVDPEGNRIEITA